MITKPDYGKQFIEEVIKCYMVYFNLPVLQ